MWQGESIAPALRAAGSLMPLATTWGSFASPKFRRTAPGAGPIIGPCCLRPGRPSTRYGCGPPVLEYPEPHSVAFRCACVLPHACARQWLLTSLAERELGPPWHTQGGPLIVHWDTPEALPSPMH